MKKPKIALIVICFVGCALSFLLILHILSQSEPKSPPASTASMQKQKPVKQPKVDYGLPVRLKIPKIDVDAAIEHMGLTPKGEMQDPTKLQDVGWYKFGPHPGNKGSAVIAGHYGLASKDTAVFNKLHTLSKGNMVYVEDEKGAIATFIVRKLKTYTKTAAVPEVFSSGDKKSHLNLVTCKGTWQQAEQTYSERLVVFTDSK